MDMFQSRSLVTAVFLFVALPLSQAAGSPEANWSGTWEDGDGGMVFIVQNERVLEVSGKDAISVYAMHCLLSDSELLADCRGRGQQLTTGKLFYYQSRWRLEENTFNEEWTAEFADGQLTGELIFRRGGK